MYANLQQALKTKGISMNAAAAVIGLPEATFRTKLQDRAFKIEEAIRIKKALFPEMDLTYLFQREDEEIIDTDD
jgi:lambda repressor-like predicted transcriptional regulator